MRPCEAPNCGNPKVENGRRCRDHVCKASNDCQGIRVPMSTFCGGHKCAVPECPSQRRLVDGSVPVSTLLVLDPTGNNLHLALGFGAFCAKHTCAQSGCSERSFRDGRFCAAHTCRHRNCAAESQDKSDYCLSHTCQSRNCAAEVVEEGHHCISHTCQAKNCTSEAQARGRYAGRCRYHEDGSDSESESSGDDWTGWPGWGFGGDGYGGNRHRGRRSGGRRRHQSSGLPSVGLRQSFKASRLS